MLPIRHIILLLTFLLFASTLSAKDFGDTLQIEEDKITSILRKKPMPDLGEGRLAKILTRYYVEGLRGEEHWDKISSLRVSGTLKLKDGVYNLDSYQKKPDLIKITVSNEGQRLILAYDGEIAWRKASEDDSPKPMSEAQARRFKHSARFGNYLLYPYAQGKKIRYIDTVPIEGKICHQIQVKLDTGYQVDYYIDIRTYLEIKVVNQDLESGKTSSIVYNDYIREFGMPIAKEIQSYEDGEWISALTIDEVKVNSGIIPWMFEMRKN